MSRRAVRQVSARVLALLLILVSSVASLAPPAQAQLTRSFVNVTGIRVRKLPNAVQIRIETDGSALFGTDLRDFISFEDGFDPKPIRSLRLRITSARSRLPAFVPLNAYPLDGAVVTLGREELVTPYFSSRANEESETRVQVELRFAAPITVRRFEADPSRRISFGEILGPNEAQIEPSPDRRAILITIITDRVDATAPARLDRSPRAQRTSRFILGKRKNGRFRLEALHTPLREVLDEVARMSGVEYLAREEIATLPVSLVLPDATPAQLLEALQIGYGLGQREENGAVVVGRDDEFFATRSFPLQNLSPDAARLLFPDFLLPFLQADRENNALLAVATPAVIEKIGADLARLDLPRAQFEIRAQAWEVASTREFNQTFALTRSAGLDSQTLDVGAGIGSIVVENGQTDRLSATLSALSARGRAKLVASPFVTALSGQRGTLFLGQTRYIRILQNRFGGQTSRALPLQIGTTLSVTPRGDDQSGEILLDIAPRVSSVDSIEADTGLPTLGIREASASVRVRGGESLILAGLDFDFDARNDGRALALFPSRREAREQRALLILVSARRISSTL
ncbi:MAG: hypothetical protein KY445_07645 [Armatimonadetes bacterium]|nr:hypothetical protein [Armatimonadota bacterium]